MNSGPLIRGGVGLAFFALFALQPARAADVKLLRPPSSFPLVITQPGSYRLKGNLTVSDSNTTAILVQADYVTIDLNGYSIQGPVTCTGSPVTSCSPSGGSGNGVDAAGHSGTVVRNGFVHGMGKRGINAAIRVENVTTEANASDGISATVVTNSVANRNGGAGISGATISGCESDGNAEYGIAGTTVINSTASGNGFGGIYATSVSNCTANNNSQLGINASSGSVSNTTADGNGGGGIVASTAIGCTARFNTGAQISGAVGVVGHNVCGDPGSPCP